YMESRKLAGAVGWYYEQTGMPVMMIGHSQGGVQALKVLHEISGSSGGGDLRVWNPVTGDFEQRTWIFEPRLRKRVPLKGSRPVIYVNAVAAGGATLAMPNQWDMIGRTREVPDATYYFTGYFIPGDVWGGGVLGASSLNRYRSAGKAKVRNFLVSHGSKHGTVPVTWHLARKASSRQWISAYHPSWRDKLPPNYEGPKRNLLWAANTWHEVKKCWCLAAQEVMRRERVTGAP
ncbi:MAG: hypothetical protein HKO57_05645, partial [Akkermansiaceae bacterium]|nr:hypothetical protein [Akkermansiaceae bacterium]